MGFSQIFIPFPFVVQAIDIKLKHERGCRKGRFPYKKNHSSVLHFLY